MTEYHSNGSVGDLITKKNSKYSDFNKNCKLKGLKQKRRGLDVLNCRSYFIDMLKALFYCHNVFKLTHRDIKPDNIMINHSNEAVLTDFGISAIVEVKQDDILPNNRGSHVFFAPEMFKNKENVQVRGEKTDIWALGVTLYYMLSGVYPSGDVND